MICNKYQPSNGTELMMFEDNFCSKCIHERFMHTQNHAHSQCSIFNKMVLGDTKDPDYPDELVATDDGYGKCTAHVPFDWGNDDNYGDDGEPILPIPVSPKQLAMPFFFEQLDGATSQCHIPTSETDHNKINA